MTDIAMLAELLDSAAGNAQSVTQLSESGHLLSLEEAYAVQALSIQRRLERGEKLIGVKMGFTSRAKMAQMGVDDLIWGRLTDAMLVENGASLNMADFVHPRIEPEIAFRLGRSLHGDITLQEAMQAVDGIAPAMEIIDSRYENFKFSLTDVVADNCSSSALVVGDWQTPDLDLQDLAMQMTFDGAEVQQGSSAEILGNPWQSLVEAARLAAQADMTLQQNWIVMAGAATAAEALRPGVHAQVSVQKLGEAAVHVNS
ncbi:MAG: 2-keto-4-pentenoate hydratase [Pseudomonadales bacterium]